MRTIDADALQKQLSRKRAEVCNARYTEGFNDALLKFKSMIHAAPTVQPQKEWGRWIQHKGWASEGYCEYTCSMCDMGVDIKYNYCPRCGTQMNGSEQE